jgi:hypothetical protein
MTRERKSLRRTACHDHPEQKLVLHCDDGFGTNVDGDRRIQPGGSGDRGYAENELPGGSPDFGSVIRPPRDAGVHSERQMKCALPYPSENLSGGNREGQYPIPNSKAHTSLSPFVSDICLDRLCACVPKSAIVYPSSYIPLASGLIAATRSRASSAGKASIDPSSGFWTTHPPLTSIL